MTGKKVGLTYKKGIINYESGNGEMYEKDGKTYRKDGKPIELGEVLIQGWTKFQLSEPLFKYLRLRSCPEEQVKLLEFWVGEQGRKWKDWKRPIRWYKHTFPNLLKKSLSQFSMEPLHSMLIIFWKDLTQDPQKRLMSWLIAGWQPKKDKK